MTPTAITAATETMGRRIRARRDASGLSLLDLMVEVRNRLPRALWVTDETIRRYEKDQVREDRADLVLIAALADVFECRISDISPLVAADLDSLADLLKRQKSWLAA